MTKSLPAPSLLLCPLIFAFAFSTHLNLQAQPRSEGRILNSKLFHLGDNEVDLVPGAPLQPSGDRLDLKFNADQTKAETTLELTYWEINNPAAVELNGQKLGTLPPSQNRKLVYLRIPAKTLRPGENTVSVIPRSKDDCVIGKIALHDISFAELMQLETVKIVVKDAANGKSLPARITVVDDRGAAAEIFLVPTNGTAVRAGLIYFNGKETEISLRKGDYTFFASRGMEWGRDKKAVSVKSGHTPKVTLQIRREVDTTGFVAADTHIHTLTFSGHGDATVEERMATLAGEGVELAVATDHNHHTDYRPYQKKLGLNPYFTPVVGNEVTTQFGHINGFPMGLDEPVPNYHETDWVKLVEEIRLRGAKVVILNHPRWKPSDVLGGLGLNTLTGEQNTYARLPFDGIELANSSAEQTVALDRFADWFALLNHGENIKAVGSSDSHAVGEVVGQGRTYLRSATDNPAKINLDEACKSFIAGHSSISLGIFADVLVENQFHAGDLVPVNRSQVRVKFRVAAPSWTSPRRALLFLNGSVFAELPLNPGDNAPFNEQLEFNIPAPKHDAHLVCVALGDKVTEPFWPMDEKQILAASNPVFLDADNDGVYRSPRETAKAILARAPNNPDAKWSALSEVDDAIAAQMLSVIYKEANSGARNEIRERLQKNAATRAVFGKFLSLANAEK
ncbi:MAG: CehA/McbA family metallohydrolase [Verrucomicrobiota bacterium]